jgi:Zn-dependent protease with chaperone function
MVYLYVLDNFMKSYFGIYSAAGISGVDCTVLLFDKKLSIGYKAADGSNIVTDWQMKDVKVDFDLARQSTRLRNAALPGELLIDGNDVFNSIKSLEAEKQKPWSQTSRGKEWIRNSLLTIAILGLLYLLYMLIVPWLSAKLASRVSIKTEQKLGNAVYDALGLQEREDTAASAVLNEFFKAMDVPTAYEIKITVVNDNVVNAFALPGGRMVVYRALLDKIETYPELAALLSHEFTHINNKHSTKSIFRRLGSKVFIGLLFGRFGSVTNVLVNHADNLKNLKYSRSLEKEADMNGLALLMKRKIDPAGFSRLFNHLKEAGGTVLPEVLVSHPDTDKRIKYISEASKQAAVEENEILKTIFDKLK